MPPKKSSAPAAAAASSSTTTSTSKAAAGAPSVGAAPPRPPKGHRQRGAGTVIRSKGEVVVSGLTMKEWERTPMTLLQEYVAHSKRPRAVYSAMGGVGVRYRLTLPDSKRPGSDKDLVFTPSAGFDDDLDAKHTIALLALHHLEPDRPHERRLPEPYRTLWLKLTSSGGSASGGAKQAPRVAPSTATVAPPTLPVATTSTTSTGAAGVSTSTAAAAAAAAGTSSTSSVAAAPPPRRLAANNVPLDVRLTTRVVSGADRSRLNAEREAKQRARVNAARARVLARAAKHSDAVVSITAGMMAIINKALRGADEASAEVAAALEEEEEEEEDDEPWTELEPVWSSLDEVVRAHLPPASTASTVHCAPVAHAYDLDAASARALSEHVTSGSHSCGASAAECELIRSAVCLSALVDTPPSRDAYDASESGEEALSRVYAMQALQSDEHEHLCEAVREAVAVESDTLASIYGDDFSCTHTPMHACTVEALGLGSDASFEWYTWSFKFNLDTLEAATDGAPVTATVCISAPVCTSPAGSCTHACAYPCVRPTLSVRLLPHTLLRMRGGKKARPTALPQRIEVAIVRSAADVEAARCASMFEFVDALRTSADVTVEDVFKHMAREAAMKRALEAAAAAPPPAPASVASASTASSSYGRRGHGSSRSHHSSISHAPSEASMAAADRAWQQRADDKRSDGALASFQRDRKKLPVSEYKAAVIEAVSSARVCMIAGETGCGKTTQIPQFLLEDAIDRGRAGHTRIIVTQPRRIAAISVAKRVAQERVEPLGSAPGAVGYHIRGEKRTHAGTLLTFMTTGVFLRLLSRGVGDITHIVIDEVHERSVDTDMCLAYLNRLIHTAPHVRVILMSATMDAGAFTRYFSGVGAIPVIRVPGRTFPVKDFYLADIMPLCTGSSSGGGYSGRGGDRDDDVEDVEAAPADGGPRVRAGIAAIDARRWMDRPLDLNLVAALINALVSSRAHAHGHATAILVFLPGVYEIGALTRMLERTPSASHMRICALHAQLSVDDQAYAFARVAAPTRKVILSTNIAETSVTIDDIGVVIDTLRVRESVYDHASGTAKLLETFVSRASAKQRCGRAGRVAEGVCYRVAPRDFMDLLASDTAPEIHRVALESVCIQVSLLGFGHVRNFMRTLMDPPPAEAVDAAIGTLLSLGAYTRAPRSAAAGDVVLTSLGRVLAQLPVDVRLGKALVYACILRCVEPVLVCVATLTHRHPYRGLTPMMDPAEKDSILAARRGLAVPYSDHLTLARVYDTWSHLSSAGEKRNFVARLHASNDVLRTIGDLRRDYVETLVDCGLLPHGYNASDAHMNAFSTTYACVTAALCAGLFPRIAKVIAPPRKYNETMSGALPRDYKPSELKFFTLVRVLEDDPAHRHEADDDAEGEEEEEDSDAEVADGDGGDAAGAPDAAAAEDDAPTPAAVLTPAPALTHAQYAYHGYVQERVFLHASSVNAQEGEFRSPWLLYHEKAVIQNSKRVGASLPFANLRDCTMVAPYVMLMFGGPMHVMNKVGLIAVGDSDKAWTRFHAEPGVGAAVKRLKHAMQELIAAKIDDPPSMDIAAHPAMLGLVSLLKLMGWPLSTKTTSFNSIITDLTRLTLEI